VECRRNPELFIGEVVFPEQVDVLHEMTEWLATAARISGSELVRGCLAETMLEQQVIPTDDGVLDETVAGLGDFLLLLVSGAELPWVSDGDRAGEPIAEFDPVEQVLDRHAQLEIVDVAQDEHRFDDPTETP